MSVGIFLLLCLVFLLMLAIAVGVMAHSHSLTVQALHFHISTLEQTLKAHTEAATKDVRQYAINEVSSMKLRLQAHGTALAMVQKAQAEARAVAADLTLPPLSTVELEARRAAGNVLSAVLSPDGRIVGTMPKPPAGATP